MVSRPGYRHHPSSSTRAAPSLLHNTGRLRRVLATGDPSSRHRPWICARRKNQVATDEIPPRAVTSARAGGREPSTRRCLRAARGRAPAVRAGGRALSPHVVASDDRRSSSLRTRRRPEVELPPRAPVVELLPRATSGRRWEWMWERGEDMKE